MLRQNIRAIKEIKRIGADYFLMNYDLLITEPESILHQLKSFLAPLDFSVKDALCAMKIDSQEGSGIDKSIVGNKSYSNIEYEKFLSKLIEFDKEELEKLGLGYLLHVHGAPPVPTEN